MVCWISSAEERKDVCAVTSGNKFVGESQRVRLCAAQPLEGVPRDRWLCFERALVVLDSLSGGVRTFLNREDARSFRDAMYINQGAAHVLRASAVSNILLHWRYAHLRVN